MQPTWTFRFRPASSSAYQVIRQALSEVGEPLIELKHDDNGDIEWATLPVPVSEGRALILQALLVGMVTLHIASAAQFRYKDFTWEDAAK